jgi:hypothetical protein
MDPREDHERQPAIPERRRIFPERAIQVSWPEQDPIERFALWLDILKSAVAIVALLVLLFFGGYAIVHGGWPIRFPGG